MINQSKLAVLALFVAGTQGAQQTVHQLVEQGEELPVVIRRVPIHARIQREGRHPVPEAQGQEDDDAFVNTAPTNEEKAEIMADEKEKFMATQEHREGESKLQRAARLEALAQKKIKEAQNEIKDAEHRMKHAQMDEQDVVNMNQQKMKNYFKKSNIYKKFVQESNEEKEEQTMENATQQELREMKEKMNLLQQKYTRLQ